MTTDRSERLLLAGVLLISVIGTAIWAGAGVALLANASEKSISTSNNSTSGIPTFEEHATQFGFQYNFTRTEHSERRDLITNAGVYVTDIGNDGQPDVLAVGGERPVLFRNTGDGFVRSDALPSLNNAANAALFLDYDNDGQDDLLLLRMQDDPLLLENRNGSFHAVEAGFDDELSNPTGAAAADYNRDGCLDVVIFQNGDWANSTPLGLQRDSVRFLKDDNGNPNYLYQGNCSLFSRVNDAGFHGATWTLAGSFADLTGDGLPDVHVGNDYNADFLYVNRGNGTFQRTLLPHSSRNAMSSTSFDANDDGFLDLFVSNVYYEKELKGAVPTLPVRGGGNNLFINQANGTFKDRAVQYGVREGGWAWAAVAADFDNDGDQSLFHTTTPLGGVYALQQTLGISRTEVLHKYPYLTYPMFFARTELARFKAVFPPKAGFEDGSGRGAAKADFDGDGKMDIVVAQTHNAKYDLYLNKGNTSNPWLGVRVEPDPQTPTLGARIVVKTDQTTVEKTLTGRAHFLSQSTRVVHVGLGNASEVRLVRVIWPDGTERTFTRVPVNTTIRVWPRGEMTVPDGLSSITHNYHEHSSDDD